MPATRRPVLAGNWKMYKPHAQAAQLAFALREGMGDSLAERDVVVAPPFTSIPAVAEALRGSGIGLAGQNMHPDAEGAFTGEISPVMLREIGCTHVILGHSERRQLFGETDDGVARKTAAALAHGLVPIVCVGETLGEREAGQTMDVVGRQIDGALGRIAPAAVAGLLVAYEPVWAIGTGKVATPAQAQEVHAFIRQRIGASHGREAAGALRILYGGSVKPDNVGALMAEPDIDGGLVGGASLSAESFLKIVGY
ncbi:MAG: triose-phosphate isomerase [Vicinamibacteria bacterium]